MGQPAVSPAEPRLNGRFSRPIGLYFDTDNYLADKSATGLRTDPTGPADAGTAPRSDSAAITGSSFS
jgi:hypothetical protein